MYLDIRDPEAVKKEIEEVAKKAAALEAQAKPKQDGLTSEVAAVDHKLLTDKARDALLYIYRSVTIPEQTGHRTDAVSISLA